MLILTGWTSGYAQLPQCGSGSTSVFYIISGLGLQVYNPALPVSPTNPSNVTVAPVPNPSFGLAIGPNVNTATPSPTFYLSTGLNQHHYYNGTAWINTGHNLGAATAYNTAAGGGYVFCIVTGGNNVYRYSGTGNPVLAVTLPAHPLRIPDLLADCEGNFYTVNAQASLTVPAGIFKYNSNGILLQTIPFTGTLPTVFVNSGGLASVGNDVFFTMNDTLWKATISGGSAVVSPHTPFPGFFNDFGSCSMDGA
ncbi:MAG TPA: hypothetical protein VGB67_05680, partial [Fibrella sp.]